MHFFCFLLGKSWRQKNGWRIQWEGGEDISLGSALLSAQAPRASDWLPFGSLPFFVLRPSSSAYHALVACRPFTGRAQAYHESSSYDMNAGSTHGSTQPARARAAGAGSRSESTSTSAPGHSATTRSKVEQPTPQALPNRTAPSAILVSPRQKGNPVLNFIKLVPWEWATDIPADYVLGATICALFLSLKYHRLHPEYIYSRIRGLAGKYRLRIILVLVDVPNHEDSLRELSKTSIVNNVTLILSWSAPEAAHYLELFKSSENAQPTAIRTQQAQSYRDSLVDFVTAPRSINKSDATSLISTFGSLRAAINAQPEEISAVPGWGEKKVRQWCGAVREDFRTEIAKKRTVGEQRKSSGGCAQPRDTTVQAFGGDIEDNQTAAASEGSQTQQESRQRNKQDEEMSAGIMEALAKLRGQGG